MEEKKVTQALFRNPPAQYRGTPFWAWNCDLEPERLEKQIPIFKEMGFGGFYMHARPGLNLPYMSEDFLDRVERCVDQAEQLGMVPHLYDEDLWPSGFAGGLVVKDHPEFRRRELHFTREPKDGPNYTTLSRYDICLNADGTMASYRLLHDGEQAVGAEWTAQVVIEEDSVRYNGSAYIDTLNPKAVQRFVEVTHVQYQKKLGSRFGTVAPSIFTDEPRTPRGDLLRNALGERKAILPWNDEFPNTFLAVTGVDIVAVLPELVWDLEDHLPAKIRWLYYDHVAELFARGFFDTIGEWCREAGIHFAGHLMDECPMLKSVEVSGETMRCYRGMDVPGIDILRGFHEFTTAKQAQSVVRQMGKKGMLSELYGSIGWDADFREHKLQGDWQAALGVTQRVPHLAWCSMQGERKRDYPQSIFYQSPWYREYPMIEDHFARVNLAMTQGKALCRIGVIQPVESFWIHCGPADTSKEALDRIEQNWQNITQWLLLGGLDFDFVSESMLPDLCETGGAPLQVGQSRYDAIVVPACETLRSSTLLRLQQFRDAGGKLVFLGAAPAYLDGSPSAAPMELAKQAHLVPFERSAVLAALSEYREYTLRDADGGEVWDYLHQTRQDSDGRWLFLARGNDPEAGSDAAARELCLTLCGTWNVELYDTLSGEIKPIFPVYGENTTVLNLSLYAHDSLLLRLTKGKAEEGCGLQAEKTGTALPVSIPAAYGYTLSEPNVLLLDVAEFRLDEENWQSAEEIGRLDRNCRRKLDWHGGVQPWTMPNEVSGHTLTLRFRIDSDVEVSGIALALENRKNAKIRWNGEDVPNSAAGWYVDWDIQTVALPPVRRGENILELTVPFEKKETMEWCYLLGNFGVEVQGTRKRLTRLPETLGCGSIVAQGLPFYSGAITYHIPFSIRQAGTLGVRVPAYHAALLKCSLDDGPEQAIAFAPYEVTEKVDAGDHVLHLTAYLNRTNAFGPVHNADDVKWFNLEAWRPGEDLWTYEYHLQEEGILADPVLTLV